MLLEIIDRDPVLADLYHYWDDKRVGVQPPSRESIDPLEMPRHVLPHLLLVELDGPLPRVRYRLVGTAITARYGEDFTGRWLDELTGPDYRELLERLYRQMRERARPVYVESRFRLGPDQVAETRRLYLPLTVNGTVSMALSVQVFPTYPFDERDFFQMIRSGPAAAAGLVQHSEWLIDPDSRTLEAIAPDA